MYFVTKNVLYEFIILLMYFVYIYTIIILLYNFIKVHWALSIWKPWAGALWVDDFRLHWYSGIHGHLIHTHTYTINNHKNTRLNLQIGCNHFFFFFYIFIRYLIFCYLYERICEQTPVHTFLIILLTLYLIVLFSINIYVNIVHIYYIKLTLFFYFPTQLSWAKQSARKRFQTRHFHNLREFKTKMFLTIICDKSVDRISIEKFDLF